MMDKAIGWIVEAVAAVATAAILYFGLQKMRPEPRPVPPPAAAPSASRPEAGPEIRYPIQTEGKPLPPLNDSDSAMREAVLALLGEKSLGALLNPQELVRHIVATIDNLPRRKVALRLMPVKPVG